MTGNPPRTVLTATFWTMGLRLAGLPLQFMAFVVVARLHGLEDTGIFAMANAVWQLARQMGPLGLDQAVMRFLPKFVAEGRHDEAEGLEGAARVWVLGAAVVAAAAVGTAALAIGPFGAAGSALATSLLFGALGIPAFAFHGLQAGLLRARRRVRAAQFPESILAPLLSAGGAALAHHGSGGAIEATLGAFVGTAYVVAITYRWLLGPGPRGRSRLGAAAEVRATAARMFFGQALNAAAARAPVLLLPYWSGASGAAMLETAARVGQLASVPTWAAGIAASPLFSEASARGDRARLQRILHLTTWAAALPAAAIFLGVLLGGSTALSWIGEAYRVAWLPTVVFCAASMINAALGLNGTLLYMTGDEGVVLRANAAALVTVVAGVAVLSPRLGVVGAALAVAAATALRDGGLTWAAARRAGIRPTVLSSSGWSLLAREAARAWSGRPR